MIVLDTSVLIGALCGSRQGAAAMRRAIEDAERMVVPSLSLYEWLRGPRLPEEIDAQEALFPRAAAVAFDAAEAAVAADLYRRVPRARGREIDLAIAACALTREAALWTLNRADFRDIPGLALYTPRP